MQASASEGQNEAVIGPDLLSVVTINPSYRFTRILRLDGFTDAIAQHHATKRSQLEISSTQFIQIEPTWCAPIWSSCAFNYTYKLFRSINEPVALICSTSSSSATEGTSLLIQDFIGDQSEYNFIPKAVLSSFQLLHTKCAFHYYLVLSDQIMLV